MAELTVLIGAGILAFLFAYIMFKLNREGESKHFLLQLLLFFLLFGMIVLIGKAIVDGSGTCEYLLSNQTLNNVTNVTNFEYSYTCQPATNDTALIVYKVTTWLFYIGILYIFLYFTYEVLKFLGLQIPFVERAVKNLNNKKLEREGNEE